MGNLKYAIISEAGVSIWSVSADAEKEFPNLKPNLRSAVSLARRLRDPLSELSRIPPQNLSVGQYQHDLPKVKLTVSMKDTLEVKLSSHNYSCDNNCIWFGRSFFSGVNNLHVTYRSCHHC